MKKLIAMFVALFVNACVVFGVVTADDLFDGIPHRKGVCVLIDCSQTLIQDVIDNSDYMLYAGFAKKTDYETVLTVVKTQECFNKTVFLEWYDSTNTSSVLPFTQHFVDVIAVNNDLVSDEECERVAVPEGRYFKMTEGSVDAGYPKVKPYPEEMGEWPMFWHAADNNPNSDDAFVRYPLMSKWFVPEIEEGTDYSKEKPTFGQTAGGIIYVVNIVDDVKYLIARNSFNGQELWSKRESDFPGLVLEVNDTEQRTVFLTKSLFCYLVDGNDNQLKCYDAATGTLVYEHTFTGLFYSGFVTGKDDIVYLASQSSDKIIVVNPTASTVVWEKDYPFVYHNYRVVMTISDIMIVASETGNITAFDKTTGNQLWETSCGKEPDLLISKSGMDFFLKVNGDLSGEVRKISDGSLQWISDDIPEEHTDDNSIFHGFFGYSAITSEGNVYAYTTHSSWHKLFSGFDGSYISEAPGGGGCARATLSKHMSFGRTRASSFYDTNSNVGVSFLDMTQCQASHTCIATFSANGSMMVLPKTMPLDQNHYALGGEGESHDYDFIPLQTDKLFQEDNYDTNTTLYVSNTDWCTYRQNNSRSSGSSVFVGDSINSSYAYNPAITSKPTAPVCVGDYTFYGRADGRIIAVNSTSGVQEWEFCTSGSIMVSPTIWNGRLYAGSEDGFVYCLEATTGRLLWRFMAGPRNRKTALNNNLKSVWPINSGILLQDDSIYFVAGRYTWDGIYAYKLNPISGEVIWRNNEAGYQNESQGKKAYAMSVATIGQNHLWINSKQTISGGPIGFNLDTGECTILKTGGSDGSQTGFFKDYLIAGGLKQYNRQEDIYVGKKGDPVGGSSSEAQKFNRLNDASSISIHGKFSSISPMGTETESVLGSYLLPAWDDSVILSSRGKYNIIECYNTDDFKAKLDAAYNPETDIKIATRWRHKSCVVWDGDLPEYKWSNMKILPHTRSMAIAGNVIFVTANEPTESQITSVTGNSFNKSKCNLSKKETFYLWAFNKFTGEQLFQEELSSEPLANGIAIDRNGKVVLTLLDGSVSFYDLGSPAIYDLTVVDGTGDGTYNKHEEVNITATCPAGKMFNAWTGDVANVADVNSANTTLVISGNTTITATFIDAPEVNLFVIAGKGTGTYYQENIVSIKANPAPIGKIFYRWTGNIETIDNIYSSATTIEIPASDISVVAEYRNKSPILIDFGSTITSPNWNNFSATLDGKALSPDSISNIITSTNEETPYNIYKYNYRLASYKTTTEIGSVDYPESAKSDYLFSSSYKDIDIFLTNLNDNNKYTLKFLVLTEGTKKTRYYINDNLVADEPGDADNTKDFNNISPVNGQISIKLTCNNAEGGRFTHLSVLEIEESVAPALNWTPENLAEHISTTSDITIAFDQAVRNIDDSEITDANVASLITLKETNLTGSNVAFTAIIDATKTVVTINPDTFLLNSKQYYVSIEAIENNENTSAQSENITFTTIATGAYALNVVNGSGDGGYASGTVVDILAFTPPGKHFVHWTGGAGSYGDANSATTTYTTVALDETITANFTNDAPTISDIADAATNEDIAKNIDFTINDAETPLNSLALYKSSSNTTLIPEDNVVFSGSGTDRTVTITPALNQYGTATVTITVIDELGLETSDSFTLTVHPVNDAPVVANAISDQETMPSVLYSYTVPESTFNDVEGDTLTYSATLDDDSPLPAWLSFNAGTRVLEGTHPLPGGETYSVKITVNDTEYSVSDTFGLTVFPDKVDLTLAVSGSGATDPTVGTHAVPYNSSQNISATPDTTSFFYNWENTEFVTVANPRLSSTTVSATDAATATAVFRDGPQFQGIKNVASGSYSVSKIVADDEGNSYLCGSFTDTIDFGNGVQIASTGSDDAFVAKFNPANICVWAKEIGGVDEDFAQSLCVDNVGNVYLIGLFENGVDFGGGYGFTSVGSADTFVAKYNANDGSTIWANQIESSAVSVFESIDVDDDNNVYIAGELDEGHHDFEGTPGIITIFGTVKYIVKYQNTDGVCLWANEAHGESLNIHNGYLLSPGIIDVDEVFGFGNGQVLTASTEYAEFFVAKYSLEGLCQDVTVIASSTHDYLHSCFIVSDNDNIYIAGQKFTDLTASGVTYLTSGGSDIYVIKLDASLNCLWGKMIGVERSDSLDDIGIDTDGCLYISGAIQRSIENSDEICYFGSNNTWGISNHSTEWYDQDLYIAKYNIDGSCDWVKGVHGLLEESNPRFAVVTPDNIKFIGETESFIYYDGNTYNPASGAFMMNITDNISGNAALQVSTTAIDVPEGSTNTFGIRLTAQPENATTVTVAHVSGDADLSVQSGASLIFSTNTWMTYQYPTIAAAEDDDFLNGIAIIRCSAFDMTDQDVTASETDDETDPNPPTVANPISDVWVSKNADNTGIDLTSVFTDTNNDDSLITKAVWANSNPTLVSASINVNTLTLDYQTDQKGTAEIVIRATSNGQTVDDTFTIEVTDPDELPWTEPFDDLNTGGLSGQHGWTADAGATVQTGTVHVGSQALSLQDATASHVFTEAQDDVVVEFQAKFVRGAATPSDTGTAVAIFSIDAEGHLVAYSNTTPITVTSTTLSDDWHSFKAQLDYAAQTWDMTVDGTLLVDDFAFYSAQSDFLKIAFTSGSEAAFIDEIYVANHQLDTDGDGVPDTWEDEHYNGITNAVATNLCANGINTILQAYIAGLNPTNASSVFKVSNVRNILHWSGTNGRIYSIYWSSNLLSGDFQPLESNLPWTAMPYTDTNHTSDGKGFYKIEVELE